MENNKTQLSEEIIKNGWVTEYQPGWDINLTYNKKFLNKFFETKSSSPTESHKYIILNFNNIK